MDISERARSISASVTLAVTAKVKRMRAEGVDVIGFGAGEPDFDTPENIKEAAVAAIEEGFTKYTADSGIDELKEAVCEKLRRDNELDYEPAEVLISNGAKHSLYNAIMGLCNPGDEVIIPAPYWLTYPEQVKLADGAAKFVKTTEDTGFKVNAVMLEEAITDRAKLLILNSPCNPTGAVYERDELEEIAEVVVKNRVYVLSDEIYEHIIYDGRKHYSIAALGDEIKDLTIVVNGVSKTYAMTGWRIGYCAGPREIIKAMAGMQSHATSNPNSIAQKAAVAALCGDQSAVGKMVAEFDRRRKYIVNRLNGIKDVSCFMPGGAFYAFPKVSEAFGFEYGGKIIGDSLSLAEFLLEEAKVAVVPGEPFGSDEHVRLSYATSLENIEEGLNRIEEVLGKWSVH